MHSNPACKSLMKQTISVYTKNTLSSSSLIRRSCCQEFLCEFGGRWVERVDWKVCRRLRRDEIRTDWAVIQATFLRTRSSRQGCFRPTVQEPQTFVLWLFPSFRIINYLKTISSVFFQPLPSTFIQPRFFSGIETIFKFLLPKPKWCLQTK